MGPDVGGILIAGLLFWSAIGFSAARKAVKSGKSLGPLTRLEALPGGYLGPAVLGFGVGVFMIWRLGQAIARMEGMVGPQGAIGYLAAVFGAVCLAAAITKPD